MKFASKLILICSIFISICANVYATEVTTPTVTPETVVTTTELVPTADIKIMYDDSYYENVILPGKTMTVQIDINNPTAISKQFVANIVTYDANGDFAGVTYGEPVTVAANHDATATVSQTFNQTFTGYAEVFMIDKSTAGIVNSISMSTEWKDYYGNTFADAYNSDISNVINGKILTSEDMDIIKVIPNITGTHIIQISGTDQLTAVLYNSNGNVIANIGQNSIPTVGTILEQNLTFGETYYISISGIAGDEYSISVSNISQLDDNIAVTRNNFVATGILENSSTYRANLISTDGLEVYSEVFNTDSTGAYNIEMDTNISTGEYYFVILKNNIIQKKYDIETVVNSCSFSTDIDEHCIIPISVSNTTSLADVRFSVSYNSGDFTLVDACDLTLAVNNVVGGVTGKDVNVMDIKPDYVVFNSTKTTFNEGQTLINSVKLKANKNDILDVYICAFKVE